MHTLHDGKNLISKWFEVGDSNTLPHFFTINQRVCHTSLYEKLNLFEKCKKCYVRLLAGTVDQMFMLNDYLDYIYISLWLH